LTELFKKNQGGPFFGPPCSVSAIAELFYRWTSFLELPVLHVWLWPADENL